MFVLEFEKPLFEFAYERPHCDLLLALPPTFSSSMMYHLFFTNSMVVEILSHGNWLFYIFVLLRNPIKRRFQLCSFNLVFYIFLSILYFCIAHIAMSSEPLTIVGFP